MIMTPYPGVCSKGQINSKVGTAVLTVFSGVLRSQIITGPLFAFSAIPIPLPAIHYPQSAIHVLHFYPRFRF